MTPAHQYPTGVVLHPSRRLALVEWARKSGGLVVEDDLPCGEGGERAVLTRAGAASLAIGALADHWQEPGDQPQGLVVGYATPPDHAYPAALDVLSRVLRAPS